MAGLVPAIHVLIRLSSKDVDARHKAGHDDFSATGLAPAIRQNHGQHG
jgi:hypothetical protein